MINYGHQVSFDILYSAHLILDTICCVHNLYLTYEGRSESSKPYYVLNSLEDIWIANATYVCIYSTDQQSSEFSEFIFCFDLLRLYTIC